MKSFSEKITIEISKIISFPVFKVSQTHYIFYVNDCFFSHYYSVIPCTRRDLSYLYDFDGLRFRKDSFHLRIIISLKLLILEKLFYFILF